MRRHPRDPHDDPPRERDRAPPGPVPTIGELVRAKMGRWVWVNCRNADCGYTAPAALVPLLIRFGAGTSSDALREGAICPCCGRRGATLQVPSSAGPSTFTTFPTFYRDGLWSDEPVGPRSQWKWSSGPTVPRPIAPAYFRFDELRRFAPLN
jgi:hypothetical protein